MKIQRATPLNEFVAKLLFLMLPTAAIGAYFLYKVNGLYTTLQSDTVQQSLYFAAGIGISALLYSFRIRFLPTFVALILILLSFYKVLDNSASGEFDAFFIARRFQIFSYLFSIGWLIGWGYTRLRYFAIMSSATLLTASIILIAHEKVDSVEQFVNEFVPVLAYAIHNIFTAEQIYNYKDKQRTFWWFLIRRSVVYSVVASIVMFCVIRYFHKDIKDTVDKYKASAQAQEDNSMLKKDKDGYFNIKDYVKLNPQLMRSNALLFCAHIDHYFPNTKDPNPLYLTEYYFTKFDTLTETFEPDNPIPSNDLFQPDPSKVPLFGTKYDTSVIRNSMGDSLREIVDAEIYNVALSPSFFTAPTVGYFVQPITVEKDFREKFRSAYRTKSYVSLLNSAYFIYNSQNKALKRFQEERFDILRHVKDYKKTDKTFMTYYTSMPGNNKFGSIGVLAHKITDTAKTPVDKVLAIRNYFLSKKENGEPLYSYTDNPGEPDIPNASKLLYFLNENHKGYCAYYAGATLFMLRSIGIPSRIAVGFLTEDRSDKNKGWYWYYANQAHAWVQVYFPGFGWLDFDTTVGNRDDDRPTPMPDGTPPMQPPKAWWAAEGIVESTDTLKRLMRMKVNQYVFHDKEYKLKEPVSVEMDMKVAVVFRDSVTIPFQKVKEGDEGTAVSYAEALKNIEAKQDESSASLIKRLPAPVPTDEVYLKRKDTEQPKKEEKKAAEPPKVEKPNYVLIASVIIGGILFFLLLLPRLVLWYYLSKYKGSHASRDKSYWAYRAATYYLHMVGVFRGKRTPMQYAKQVVDPLTGGYTFVDFMNIYLKKKYAKQELNEREMRYVDEFLMPFIKTCKAKIKTGDRILGFLNTLRMKSFFALPPDDEKDT